MRPFKLIKQIAQLQKQIAQLQKKIADLELSLSSQRSINRRLMTENSRLTQEITGIGNSIYLSIPTFKANYANPCSNIIRANCDITWESVSMSAKAKLFDDLYEQGYIKRVQNEDSGVQTLYCMRVVK